MCTANQKPCTRAAVATRVHQCYASLYSTIKPLNQNVSVAKVICQTKRYLSAECVLLVTTAHVTNVDNLS